MTKLNQQQCQLLQSVLDAGDAPMAAPTHKPPELKRLLSAKLVTVVAGKLGAESLVITEAGRALLEPVASPPEAKPLAGKLGAVLTLLERPQGASIAELMATTGWQAHSVRGAIAGTMKKKRGLQVTSEKGEQGRVYKVIAASAP